MSARGRVLITGGTRGIGAATALVLAESGHDLVLGFRADRVAAEQTAARVRSRGAGCLLLEGDLTDPGGIEELFTGATRDGSLAGVVNNAGGLFRIAALAQTPPHLIRRSIELNLLAPLLVARSAVRCMGTSYGGAGGVLVNVSSGAATLGSPGEYVHYAAAKAGVDALTIGLAKEVAMDGIRVVGVAPGLVETRIHADAGEPGRPARVAPTVPMERAGTPDEIARVVAFALSDAASYVTGTTLRVAGGR
ncbi:MAG: SDR family oxidoreductase [Nocardioides sp.]